MMASHAIKIQNKKQVNTGCILNSAAADCSVKIHAMTKTTEKTNKAVEYVYLKYSSSFHAVAVVVELAIAKLYWSSCCWLVYGVFCFVLFCFVAFRLMGFLFFTWLGAYYYDIEMCKFSYDTAGQSQIYNIIRSREETKSSVSILKQEEIVIKQ